MLYIPESPTKASMPDLADFITTEEAARKLGFNIQTIRSMVRNSKLEGLKISGRTWLVSKKSVEAYLTDTQGLSKNDPRRKQK